VAQPIVYGDDTRLEYFEASAGVQVRMAESAVALLPRQAIDPQKQRLATPLPTWGEIDGLCPGEPFADQPAAAFCSGVLVDWDLVLTAGHCAISPEAFVAVMGYYYSAPGALELGTGDVLAIKEIVHERHDPPGAEPRLDYAFLRLSTPVQPPRRPAPVHVSAAPAERDSAVFAIGAQGGAPLKAAMDASVQDGRNAALDYFIANTDTSTGSSGGGAFDAQLALLGVLARGGIDLRETEAGCVTTARAPAVGAASEQFTYAFRAVQGLCAQGKGRSALCRRDCGEPCQAARAVEPEGCALTRSPRRRAGSLAWSLSCLLALLSRRQRANRISAC